MSLTHPGQSQDILETKCIFLMWWWESHRNAERNHLRLVFGREGGGGGGVRVETPKMTTSGSRLDMREVVVVGVASKRRNQPPPARIWTRGRWWWWQGLQMSFCPGGKVSDSKWGGWKIRTAKTSHDENRGSFCCDAPFASSFLPSLGSSLPLQAHIPHERGGASCGRHSGGGRKRRSRSCLVV